MKHLLVSLALCLPLATTHAQTANEYPAPIKALTAKGITIRGTLDAPPGFKGYAAEAAGRALPIYLLPDGKHTVIGTLFDQAGNDLTRAPMDVATTPVLDANTWAELGKASWVAEGAEKPERIVYVITDTECPYCHKLWQATQPHLKQSRVQVRHIIVAVISPQSLGRASAILGAADPSKALHQHEAGYGNSPIKPLSSIPDATRKQVEKNIALMDRLGVTGTPSTFYKNSAGKVSRADGLITDEATLKAIFGG